MDIIQQTLCKVCEKLYEAKVLNNNKKANMSSSRLYIMQDFTYCIAHQNYAENARIIVIERENELEFRNKGNFYDGNYED